MKIKRDDNFDKIIRTYLPFYDTSDAWRRIEKLESVNKQIVESMMHLAEVFRLTVEEPRKIYLTVQEVRSRSVYIRWRRKGANGNQKYLVFNSIGGKGFLMEQSNDGQILYQKFNHWALQLNLAHSLRLNEIRRIKKYLQTFNIK